MTFRFEDLNESFITEAVMDSSPICIVGLAFDGVVCFGPCYCVISHSNGTSSQVGQMRRMSSESPTTQNGPKAATTGFLHLSLWYTWIGNAGFVLVWGQDWEPSSSTPQKMLIECQAEAGRRQMWVPSLSMCSSLAKFSGLVLFYAF